MKVRERLSKRKEVRRALRGCYTGVNMRARNREIYKGRVRDNGGEQERGSFFYTTSQPTC